MTAPDDTVAIAIICKNPQAGRSKTRLGAVLSPDECAAISACFIADLAATIQTAAGIDPRIRGYALYTPIGSEAAVKSLLPEGFGLVPQVEGDFGERLFHGTADLLALGHAGAIVLNSDSPTLPLDILLDAASAVLDGDRVVLGPSEDGGYTLIGLARPHRMVFEDIAWSTETVLSQTRERAEAAGLPVTEVGRWYDVDDRESLDWLVRELGGERLPFALKATRPSAPRTRAFLARTILAPTVLGDVPKTMERPR